MFGILDDDTDTKNPYIIFGFKHLNPSNPCEASADFTNIEEIIDHVTKLISRIYPNFSSIALCFQEAKDNFINHKSTRSFGGKRRTKRRKTKRRKTRRRRKY